MTQFFFLYYFRMKTCFCARVNICLFYYTLCSLNTLKRNSGHRPQHVWISFCVLDLEICMVRFFLSPGPTRIAWNQYQPGLKREIKISAWTQPVQKQKIKSRPGPANYFSDFGPNRLHLSDFKTDTFSCLHMINVFFLLMIYFPAIY